MMKAKKFCGFQVPLLDETEYHDMVDWQTLAVKKPLVTIYLTDNELKDMIFA